MSKDDDLALLRELEDVHGTITAERVVDAARDPDHPWHTRFAWDDVVAGENYRLQQARALIRSVRYERKVEHVVARSVHYVRDPTALPHEQRYKSVVALQRDEDEARAVLIAEFSRIGALIRRTRALGEVLGLQDDINRLVEDVEHFGAMLRLPPSEGTETRQ